MERNGMGTPGSPAGGARIARFSSRGTASWSIAAACLILILSALPAAAITNEDCLGCHGDQSLTRTGADGKTDTLYVAAEAYKGSIHGAFGCTDCHADIVEVPHAEKLNPVDCATCHSDVQEHYAASSHGKAVQAGRTDAPKCSDCHGMHDILPASNPASHVSQQNLVATCAGCHANPKVIERIGQRGPVEGYMKSVHGQALLVQGNPAAPGCGTCHPAHDVLPPGDPASSVNRMNLPKTCAQCHGDVYETYSTSTHGVAAALGNTDSPTCIDCHGEHDIEGPKNPDSPVFPANIAKTTCTRCHSSLILSRRYGFSAGRISSYMETYHGLAGRKGDLSVANCASCHGVHNIYPSSDARSTVNRANLTKTCGHCHPDANARFASISVHPRISGASGPKPPAEVVRWVYALVILGVIGGMAAHNGLIWWYHVSEKRRREQKAKKVRRFTKLEAVEHQLNLIAFFVLCFTGFALKFPDSSWVRLTEKLGMTEDVRGLVHRVMAVLMIAIALVHTCYLLFTRRGRRDLVGLMPRLSDVRDFIQNMAYHLRLNRKRPVYPRFDYTEKAEYLALIWGTSVMILTGFILWFPTIASRHLPAWAFPVAEVVHYYEAWLAFLAILVWHFFFVIFHPDAYPMNLTWMDGQTTEEHMLHKHGKLEDDDSGPKPTQPTQPYGGAVRVTPSTKGRS